MHWTMELAFPNHSLLHHCNEAMKCAGIEKLPFSNVRILPPFDPGDDDPEFFMDYWHKEIDRQREFPRSTCSDRCNCPMCGTNSEALPTAPDVAGDYVGLPLITERPPAAETNNTVERVNDTVQTMDSDVTVDLIDNVDTVDDVNDVEIVDTVHVNCVDTVDVIDRVDSVDNVDTLNIVGTVDNIAPTMESETFIAPLPTAENSTQGRELTHQSAIGPTTIHRLPLTADSVRGFFPNFNPMIPMWNGMMQHTYGFAASMVNQANLLQRPLYVGVPTLRPKSNSQPCNCPEWQLWNYERSQNQHKKGGRPRHSIGCPRRSKCK